jgi:hypothetical protein
VNNKIYKKLFFTILTKTNTTFQTFQKILRSTKNYFRKTILHVCLCSQIKIRITDINNKSPQVESLRIEVELYENATSGDLIWDIKAVDLDRDGEYSTIFSRNIFFISMLHHSPPQRNTIYHKLCRAS